MNSSPPASTISGPGAVVPAGRPGDQPVPDAEVGRIDRTLGVDQTGRTALFDDGAQPALTPINYRLSAEGIRTLIDRLPDPVVIVDERYREMVGDAGIA
ncbi:hypothetical protein H7H37_10130, partial [Mycolicibacterium insubricum]|nr:hypothetical protein [Mycolicibacterium insubricum]